MMNSLYFYTAQASRKISEHFNQNEFSGHIGLILYNHALYFDVHNFVDEFLKDDINRTILKDLLKHFGIV